MRTGAAPAKRVFGLIAISHGEVLGKVDFEIGDSGDVETLFINKNLFNCS